MLKDIDQPGVIHAQRSVSLVEAQQLRDLLGEEGTRMINYSFNPDNFPNTFNCVTWGCTQLNQFLEHIPISRQGRVKLILDTIKNLPEPWHITIGGHGS